MYAELCRRFADDPVASEIVGPDPSWDMPLRLLGGLHYLVLGDEASWDDPLDAHREFLSEFVREQGVQTNEVQRAWVLTPLFLRVAERTGASSFDVIELGASAGLLLGWDRYRSVYEQGEWGPEGSPLTLSGTERSPVRADLLEQAPKVGRRVGVDLAPIDVTSDDAARLLKCFVWAGQEERLERLDQAIAAVREDPPDLVRADYVEVLPELLSGRDRDALTVVFASATLRYVGDEGVARIRSAFDEAGAGGPLAFIATGSPRSGVRHWGLRIVYYPGADREYAGEADYHATWLDWQL